MSICIPTKNRIDALKATITSITTNSFFRSQDDIEIVIANSGDTEGFHDLILILSNEFPNRVIYVESPSATAVENFSAALNASRGNFKKIINDTAIWSENAVWVIYHSAKKLHENHGLLVTPNTVSVGISPIENFNTVSEFIGVCSIYSTWLGCYGFWAEDIGFVIEQMRVHSDTELPHLHAFLGLVSRRKIGSVLLQNIFNVQVADRKGTYSLSKVFVKNYLRCLRNFNITGELYEREKSKALVHTLSYHFNPRYDFYKQPVFEDLADVSDLPDFKEKFLEYRNSFIRYLNPSLDRGQLWRLLNPHNETIISGNANISRVYVGRATYGTLNAHWWGAENEFLFLGNYVSIAQNVVFLLGGNHPYQGFSTFPFKVKSFGAKEEAISKGPIIVEDDVWIGWGSIILSGVRVGKGAVIGAGSVVSKNIPSYSIVVGNPAKVIGYRFEDSIREKLSKRNFHSLRFDNRGTTIERLYERLTPENVDSVLEEIFGC